MKLSKNFSLAEFTCGDGTPVPEDCLDNVLELASNLQVIRDFFGTPVTVNSGYRTSTYNAKVGGKPKSKHLTASAADIVIEGFTAAQVADAIEGLTRIGAIKNGGIGRYRTFTHYDIGPRRRWDG